MIYKIYFNKTKACILIAHNCKKACFKEKTKSTLFSKMLII